MTELRISLEQKTLIQEAAPTRRKGWRIGEDAAAVGAGLLKKLVQNRAVAVRPDNAAEQHAASQAKDGCSDVGRAR